MRRLLLCYISLLRWQHWAVIAIPVVVGLATLVLALEPVYLVMATTLFVLLSLGTWQRLQLFRRGIRRFRRLSTERVLLRYAPSLEDQMDLARYAQEWEQALQEMSERFGFALQRRLVVYLFATSSEIGQFSGRATGAAALIGADAVIAAADAQRNWRNPTEIMRHELAHLFSAYWGRCDPLLKSEGLAVYLQGSEQGHAVGFSALASLLGGRYVPLADLRDRATFWIDPHSSYGLAGSFTSFVVDRFGWDCYRAFYCCANASNFEPIFEKTFGVTLRNAEREWRQRLLSREESFGPDLRAAMLEQRAKSAYLNQQAFLCLETCEEGFRSTGEHAVLRYYAAVARILLGEYDEAARLLSDVLATEEPRVRPIRAAVAARLGQVYDAMGERERAVAAYQQALAAPDWWDTVFGSTHARVRGYLQRPVTERMLLGLLRQGREWALHGVD